MSSTERLWADDVDDNLVSIINLLSKIISYWQLDCCFFVYYFNVDKKCGFI